MQLKIINIIRNLIDGEKSNSIRQDEVDPLRLFKKTFDSSKSPIYFVDNDYNIVWANEEFRNICRSDEGKCFEIVCEFERPCPNCPAERAFQSNEVVQHEVLLSTKKHRSNGYAFSITSIPVLIAEPPVVMCIVQPKSFKTPPLNETEVAPKIKNFKELIKTDNFVSELLEASPFGVVVFDEAFRFLDCNLSAEKIFHFKEKNKAGQNVASLIPIPEKFTHSELISELRKQQSPTFDIDNYVNHTGENFDFALKYFPIFEDLRLKFIVLLLWEIKEKSLLPIDLRRKNELFQQLFEKIPIGLLVFDEINVLRYANDAARNLFETVELKVGAKAKELDLPEIVALLTSDESQAELILEAKIAPAQKRIIGARKFLLPSTLFGFGWKAIQFDDITFIRQLEQDLETIRGVIAIFAQRFEGLLLRLSTDLKVVNVFSSVSKLLGLEPEKLISGEIKWLDLIHPDDSAKVREVYREAVHFPNYTRTFTYRLVNPNGEVVWVENHLENVADSRGKIVYLQSLIYNITERITVEEQLKNSQEQLRNLALYFESLREEEKKNLAFEIHDELGHVLTAMKLELSWMLKKKHLREEVLHERILKMIDMIESTIRKVRSISSQLRPSVLDHFGIVAAIEWQSMEFQKQTAIRCRLYLTKQEIKLNERTAIAVFRIFQEILTNVARHANATRVDVHLEVDGNNLILTVSDNGRGIKLEEISKVKSLGIVGMKERANAVNGKLTIQGVSNVGTTVTLTLPIN